MATGCVPVRELGPPTLGPPLGQTLPDPGHDPGPNLGSELGPHMIRHIKKYIYRLKTIYKYIETLVNPKRSWNMLESLRSSCQ